MGFSLLSAAGHPSCAACACRVGCCCVPCYCIPKPRKLTNLCLYKTRILPPQFTICVLVQRAPLFTHVGHTAERVGTMKMVGRKGMRWAAVSLALMALTIGLSTSKVRRSNLKHGADLYFAFFSCWLLRLLCPAAGVCLE